MSGRNDSGQATVELVGLLPLVVVVVVGAVVVHSAASAHRAAAAAAHAGALAVLQDRDGQAAARRALSGWPPGSWTVLVRGGRVTVQLRPRLVIPALASRLRARAVAGFAAERGDGPPAEPRGGDGRGAAGRGDGAAG